jgi:hypothetical protein
MEENPKKKDSRNGIEVEIDVLHRIEFSDVAEEVKEKYKTFNNQTISWLVNVNVPKINNDDKAEFKVVHTGGRPCVYLKGDRVLPLPPGRPFLPVGDPPIGII